MEEQNEISTWKGYTVLQRRKKGPEEKITNEGKIKEASGSVSTKAG